MAKRIGVVWWWGLAALLLLVVSAGARRIVFRRRSLHAELAQARGCRCGQTCSGEHAAFATGRALDQ